MQVSLRKCKPRVQHGAFVHRDAVVMGNVRLSPMASVWQGAVLRSGKGLIRIGEGTNIQAQCVMQASQEIVVGRYSSLGKGALLHDCTIGDHCVIGDGAVILDDAVIGDFSIVGEGAVVGSHCVIPPRSLVFGNPARVQGQIDGFGLDLIRKCAQRFVRLAKNSQ